MGGRFSLRGKVKRGVARIGLFLFYEKGTISRKTIPALRVESLMNWADRIPLGGIVTVRDRLLELQAQGKSILRLESGDPSFEVPPHILEAIHKALRDGHTHYTAGAGIPRLREAIVEKLRRENQIPVEGSHRVLVTSGAMNALYIAYKALIEEPGDEIIVPDPTWTETFDNITLNGGKVVRAPLDPERNWSVVPGRIEELVTNKTRAIVLNSPHNPTGGVLSRDVLERVLLIALKYNLKIISDEAYEHVLFDKEKHISIGSLPGAEKCVVSIFSMSKSYAMSGLRVGYVASNDDLLIERMGKLLRCTVNGVNSATQHGAVAALEGSSLDTFSMCKTYQERRDLLVKGLSSCRLFLPYNPQGAFYVWAKITEDWKGFNGDRNSWAMSRYLVERGGLGSAPGEVFGPGGAGYLRFAFSCSTPQVQRASEILGNLT